jgi:hypothetical protein
VSTLTQFEIDFSGRLPVSAQIGMATADEHANTKWKTIIDGCILAAARRLPELTVDDVLEEYEKLPESVRPTTHALDALGPAMIRASKSGILKSTGRVTRSKRDGTHGNRHSIWHSTYYEGAK